LETPPYGCGIVTFVSYGTCKKGDIMSGLVDHHPSEASLVRDLSHK